MRKITEHAAQALLAGKNFKCKAVTVECLPSGRFYRLHGNLILSCSVDEAGKINGLATTLADCPTVSTRERLNGTLAALHTAGVMRYPGHYFQRAGTQYVSRNGQPDFAITGADSVRHQVR